MRDVVITMRYKEEDYFRYQIFILFWIRKFRLVLYALFPLIGIYGIIYSGNVQINDIILIILPFVLLLLLWIRNNRRYINNKIYQYPETFTISNEEVLITSEINQVKLNWNDISKVYITKKLIILGVSDIHGFIITNNFIGEVKYDDIKEKLKGVIPKHKIQLYPYYPF